MACKGKCLKTCRKQSIWLLLATVQKRFEKYVVLVVLVNVASIDEDSVFLLCMCKSCQRR